LEPLVLRKAPRYSTDRLIQFLPFLSLLHFSFTFFFFFFLLVYKSPSLHPSTCIAGVHFLFPSPSISFIDQRFSFLLITRVPFLHYPVVHSVLHSFITQPFTQPFVTHIRKRGVFPLGRGFGGEKKRRNFEVGWSWVYLLSFFIISIVGIYCYVSQGGGTSTVLYEYFVLGCLMDWCGVLCLARKNPVGWVVGITRGCIRVSIAWASEGL